MRDDARPRVKHPNDERTSDQSTPSASGLGAGRDLEREERMEREQREEREDIIARDDPRRTLTPRRYDEEEKDATDPTLPSNDSPYRTEI